MIESSVLLMLAIFLPLLAAGVINLFSGNKIISPLFGLILCGIIAELGLRLLSGEIIEANLYEFLPGIILGFRLESLGLIFAAIASLLWVITAIYSVGYLQKTKDPKQPQFFIYLAISISMALGIAFSANLLVMFIFYELLTLLTYPLVAHKGDSVSISAGRKYLLWLIGLSVLLFLPAIIMVYHLTGTLDFSIGGVIGKDVSKTTIILLLSAFIFGIGKAALMPFHWWLPNAMVAPTPVSALLHAVAVVKAGVFCILKIAIYIFGTENLSYSATAYISYIAVISIIGASIIALFQDNLKKRLAYSTVSQLAYVVLAMSLLSSAAITAGAMQLVAHAFAKITLFFAAGVVITVCGAKYINEMDGIGRKIPIAMICFFICSLSLIGLPFTAGAEVKTLLSQAADVKNQTWIIYALYLSALLNAAYLLPITYRAFFRPLKDNSPVRTPRSMNFAIIFTTLALLGFGLYSDIIIKLMGSL